jgi:hypothetical protein
MINSDLNTVQIRKNSVYRFSYGWFRTRDNGNNIATKLKLYVFLFISSKTKLIGNEFLSARDPQQLFDMLRSNPEMLQQVRQNSPQAADAIQRGDFSTKTRTI